MKIGSALLILVLTFAWIPAVHAAAPSAKRESAFKTLIAAHKDYLAGNVKEGRKAIDKALALDPDLAYANYVRGEVAMNEEDWANAQKFYEKTLQLVKQPNQPLSPDKNTKVTAETVEGNTRCFLGYVYIKQAQGFKLSGKQTEEQKYLKMAYKSLKGGLALTPEQEARDLAERLLKMFPSSPSKG